jgi:adenylate kinase family enzyme
LAALAPLRPKSGDFGYEAGDFGYEAGDFGYEAGHFGYEAGDFGYEAGHFGYQMRDFAYPRARRNMDFSDTLPHLLAARRVLVLGSSGSGKTTFTRQLGPLLNLEPIHLDACFWQPGWVSTPQDEWREKVAVLVERESWIMDGTYESTLDLRIPAADCVIVLERSRLVCLWRVLKRKVTLDDRRRPDAPSGQKLDAAFLRYIWRYPQVTQSLVFERIRQYGPHKALIVLRGAGDIERLLRRLSARATV